MNKVFKMKSKNITKLIEKINEYSIYKIDSAIILRLEDASYFLTIHYYENNEEY